MGDREGEGRNGTPLAMGCGALAKREHGGRERRAGREEEGDRKCQGERRVKPGLPVNKDPPE